MKRSMKFKPRFSVLLCRRIFVWVFISLGFARIGFPRVLADPLPNFVIIFTDDMGWADLGSYGERTIQTPRLDKMAEEGMRFTQFYAQPICGPSRAAIMTGCQPMRVAEIGNRKNVHPELHPEEITIAEILKEKGYVSKCIGKWDLARHSQRNFIPHLLPTYQGFDEFFGTPTSNDQLVDLYEGEECVQRDAPMATLTKRYTDSAIEFMRRKQDQPFFIYLPHSMVHTRLAASADYRGRSERGLYGDAVEELDFQTGRILDEVKRLGLDEKTWVIFTSDNGPWLIKNRDFQDGELPTDHGGSAGPLRSGKVSTWEGGVRVPCIVRAPGQVPAGQVCHELASTLDILPTMANLAGCALPQDRVLDGEDITPLLQGNFQAANSEKVFLYYLLSHLQAVRKGPWKLHVARPRHPQWLGRHAVNRHIHPRDDVGMSEPQLYHLIDDPGEQNDLAKEYPTVVEQLLVEAEKARQDIGDYDRIGKNMRFYDPLGKPPLRPQTNFGKSTLPNQSR